MTDRSPVPVDLTNCDREPIHLISAVQPFGFLIAVSGSDWIVTRASANVCRWLGREPADLLGQAIHQVLPEHAVHAIRGHLQSAIMADTVARAFGLTLTPAGPRFDVAVYISGDSVVIECEPSIDEPALNAGALVRGMIARLHQTSDQRTFYRIAAREMRALTGFDRVMVYRFDPDGSGEVIAEAARAGLDPYLGLHYPASDIPQQARVLYQRNWLRIIPDIKALPAPIDPLLDRQRLPLDLSLSILRSVSPIHIEYLRNMGVDASMSVSILGQNKLWGLFACHHYTAHHVGFARRTAAELFGQMFSLLNENREREEEAAYEARAQKLHQQLVTVMATEATRFESIIAHLDDIADLLTCDGIAVWVNDRAILKGLTPNDRQFAALVAYLQRKGISEIYARHDIGSEYPDGRDFAERAAGMLVVPLSRPAGDYLVFFRKEVARAVNWAGDPSKPVTVGPLGARLTPRTSFELWKETVSGQAQHWLPVECRIAEALRVSLLEVILRLSSLTEAERRRAQERQELLIAELNHRVRNIFSLIRGVITQSRDSATSLESFTKVVGGRIHALARAHDQITADNWGPASFHLLVNAEAGAYLGGKANRIVISGPDILLEPQAFTTVALVIHEMVTNSAKYGALSDARGRVEISTNVDRAGHLVVDWKELGGPAVKAPTRRGFGSTVIERSIAHDLKGEAELEYELAGVKARFTIPAAYVRMPQSQDENVAGSAATVAARVGPLPEDVLLVEDNMIIALDTEDMMLRLGVATVRIASGVAEALKAIEERAPSFALLDVNLGAETSFEIAEALTGRCIRFAFATGYGEQVVFPTSFADAPRLRKPYAMETLRATLEPPAGSR
jgi:light-regulated signal transduction histidine kinase (bacteriophytochrome)/CheY-like chemotaxis protein